MKASRFSCRVRSAIAHLFQRSFVVCPSAADLDQDFKIDFAAEHRLHILTSGGGDLFHLAPARSDDDRFVSFLFHHDGGVIPPDAALPLEFLYSQAGDVGKLLPEKAKQLFANQLRREKPLVTVGELVSEVNCRLLRQVARKRAPQLVEPLSAAGADRNDFLELRFARRLFQKRQHARGVGGVDLVHDQEQRDPGGHLCQHHAIFCAEALRFDNQDRHIDRLERSANRAVHHAIGRTAMPRLESGRIDEDELRRLRREDTAKAMSSGLRLARGDAEFLPQQRIHQGGLADVGAPDQSDRAATKRLRGRHGTPVRRRICSNACMAASCSAFLRLLPLPVVRTESWGIRHSTSKSWLCGAPWVATTEYCGNAILFAWSNSCRSVFGSFPSAFGSKPSSSGSDKRQMASPPAEKPPSTKTAPISASKASARMEGRANPPLFSSPSPSCRVSPSPSVCAT